MLDTRATEHFVCSVDLLSSITATMQSLVQSPNGELAQLTMALLFFLLLSLSLMFFVFHLLALICYLLALLHYLNLIVLFSSPLIVLSRTFYLGKRLGWARQLMACSCCSMTVSSILILFHLLIT